MSSSSIQYYGELDPAAAVQTSLEYSPRNRFQALFFLPSVLVSGVSWLGGGIPILSDLSFAMLTLLCIIMLIEEFAVFSRRFGMGGITLFGGILMWFCVDYMKNWFFVDFSSVPAAYTPAVVAKSVCLHQIFVFFMVCGLHLPVWKRMESIGANLPEPRSHGVYFGIILVAFFIGMVPYIFFTQGFFPLAILNDMIGGRGGEAGFIVGRTGNVNYSWGAYLSQFLQVGQIGAIFAIFYVIIFKPGLFTTLICIFIWLIQCGLAFGGGTRGQTAYIFMPALFLVFLKYQSQAAEMLRRFSLKAYVASGIIGLVILVILQIQITYRNIGFHNIEIGEVKTEIEGNSMFSEGLAGMALIPEQAPFFYNKFPGEGVVLAIPEFLWRLAYGPIPRALWNSKPIDPMWAWYNSVVTGRSQDDLEGTTISSGLVGDWYFRFGLAGLIEGGLLYGWLYMMCERMLQNSQGKLIQMVTAIGLLVYLFRDFRGTAFINLYPLLIGVIVLIFLIKMTGSRSQT